MRSLTSPPVREVGGHTFLAPPAECATLHNITDIQKHCLVHCAVLCDRDYEDSIPEALQNKAGSGKRKKNFRQVFASSNCTESAKINQDETDSCWLFKSFLFHFQTDKELQRNNCT